MAEPWFVALRERKPRGVSGERGVLADLSQWEMLALLDIAEAAQKFIATMFGLRDPQAENSQERADEVRMVEYGPDDDFTDAAEGNPLAWDDYD